MYHFKAKLASSLLSIEIFSSGKIDFPNVDQDKEESGETIIDVVVKGQVKVSISTKKFKNVVSYLFKYKKNAITHFMSKIVTNILKTSSIEDVEKLDASRS